MHQSEPWGAIAVPMEAHSKQRGRTLKMHFCSERDIMHQFVRDLSFQSSMEDKGDRARTALSSDHSHTRKFTRRRKKKHQHRNVTSGAAGTIMMYNSRNEKVEESQSGTVTCMYSCMYAGLFCKKIGAGTKE